MVFCTPLVPVTLKLPAPLMVLTELKPLKFTGFGALDPEPAWNELPV